MKFNLNTNVVHFIWFIIYFNPVLVLNLDGWFSALPNKFLFDISLLYYFINIRSSILFCLSSGDIYLYDVYLQLFLNYFVMNFLRRWQFYQQFYFQSDQLLLLFFDIPLLYYYINLGSLIISCISSGDIYLSLSTSLSCLFVIVSKLFCGKFFKFSSCNSISNFITNQDTNWFCCVFSYSFCLAWSRIFWLHLPLKFLLKNQQPFSNIPSLVWTEYLVIFYILHFN